MTRTPTILRIDARIRHVDSVSRKPADRFLADLPAHPSVRRDVADGVPPQAPCMVPLRPDRRVRPGAGDPVP